MLTTTHRGLLAVTACAAIVSGCTSPAEPNARQLQAASPQLPRTFTAPYSGQSVRVYTGATGASCSQPVTLSGTMTIVFTSQAGEVLSGTYEATTMEAFEAIPCTLPSNSGALTFGAGGGARGSMGGSIRGGPGDLRFSITSMLPPLSGFGSMSRTSAFAGTLTGNTLSGALTFGITPTDTDPGTVRVSQTAVIPVTLR